MARFVGADEVQSEDVDYLPVLGERIPRGMLTFIAGKRDVGKGLSAIHIAAECSKQGLKVVYSAAEDSRSKMTKPRLEAAGAVLKNVKLWEFFLPDQIEELEERCIEHDIDLVILDPLNAHVPAGFRQSDKIRQVTGPLKQLAEDVDCAVIVIEHTLKRVAANSDPLDAIGGTSSGFVAACRMGYFFGVDPGNEELRVLACGKSNIRDKPPAVFFETDEAEVEPLDRPVPFLVYDSEGPFDAIRLVQGKTGTGKTGRPADKRAAAAEWLTNYLAEKGATKATDIYEDAKQHNMTSRTLRRACADMGIVRQPPQGGPNCTWELPQEILDLLHEASKSKEEEEAGSPEEKVVAVVPLVDIEAEVASLYGVIHRARGQVGHIPAFQEPEPEMSPNEEEGLITDDDLQQLLEGLGGEAA